MRGPKTASDTLPGTISFILEGQVVATNHDDQMGSLKVWVPSLDGENYDIDQLPWTEYASPFSGFTVAYPAGQNQVANAGDSAYGFWAIPKIGATVFIFCVNGDPNTRFWFACSTRLHRNRSLPAGRNFDGSGEVGPFSDSGDGSGKLDPLEPGYSNLRVQFQDQVDADEAITRGGYERQVAQAATNKDGSEGYAQNPVDPSYLDCQTYCFVTPGRNSLIMQDNPSNCRIRIKTAEGNQMIFDDANERIYMSTSHGRSWVEMDKDGRIHVYGEDSISYRTGGDFNVFADGSFNVEAKAMNLKTHEGDVKITSAANLQLKSTAKTFISSCEDFHVSGEAKIFLTSANGSDLLSGGATKISSAGNVDMKAGGNIVLEGSKIMENSGSASKAAKADCAEVAESPTVVPAHEPWTRDESKLPRSPTWKP